MMTEDERVMLRELHQALLAVPPGSSKDDKPLLEEIRGVVLAYKRASWVTRAIVWLLPAIAGVGVAFQTIRDWFPHAQGGGAP